MAPRSRFKKLVGGIAAAVALTFVAAPVATAAPDDAKSDSAKVKPLRDSGWGR
jgi:Ni/Co efflux regulator RcnB